MMSPLSFLILVICVLSLFLLVRLARGLSILLLFSQNYFLVSLIFSVDFQYSSSLISALILMISFLLLTLDVTCSFFFLVETQIVDFMSFSFLNLCRQPINFLLNSSFPASPIHL